MIANTILLTRQSDEFGSKKLSQVIQVGMLSQNGVPYTMNHSMTQSLNLLQSKVMAVISEGQEKMMRVVGQSLLPEFNLQMKIDGLSDSSFAS